MSQNNDDNNSCCCCCCFNCLKLIFTLGLTVLFFYLIYRPSKLKVHVASASLSAFNLPTPTTLSYDLALSLAIRNPNRRVAFYYDSLDAQLFYGTSSLGYSSTSLPAFFQHHKNTTVVQAVFKGEAKGLLDPTVNGTFARERGEGEFGLEVKVRARVRVKVMFFKFGHFKPKFDCVVKVPAPSSKKGFQMTECDVDF